MALCAPDRWSRGDLRGVCGHGDRCCSAEERAFGTQSYLHRARRDGTEHDRDDRLSRDHLGGGARTARDRRVLRTHAQIRASCGMLWRAWSDGGVPLRMELVALDVEACHLLVSNLDPFRIAPRVQHAVHG